MPNISITNSVKIAKNEQIPTILLSEAFMADDSINIRPRYGEYKATRGRLPEFLDSEGVKVKTPTDVFTIVSITSGTKKIVVTGNVLTGSTALADGATIRVNGSTTTANNITFTVDGTPTFSSPNSTITVTEPITTQAASGSVFVGTTPVIAYHRHVEQATSADSLLVATVYHIFKWRDTDKSLSVLFTSGSPGTATHWSFKTHLDSVYATNNVDLIQVWTGTGVFGDLGSASGVDIDGAQFVIKARFLESYEGYLFLFYPTYNDNSIYPLRVHHSSLSDPTDFDINSTGDAGLKNFNSTPDFLVGSGIWQNNIIVFKQERHIRGTFITTKIPFRWDEEELKVGAISQDAITNDRAGRLYWLASDLTIREIRTPIDVSTLVDKTIKGLNVAVAEFAQMTFIDIFGTINLAIAGEASTTNNRLISFNPENADTFLTNTPVRAFGDYTRKASFTYDTLPFSFYPDWGASWIIYDSVANAVGFLLDLASDYNGDTFDLYQAELDNGVAITRAFVFNTNMGEPFPFKRVNNGMYGIFRRQSSGSVNVFIKINTSSGWTLLGAMSLVDSRGQEFVIVHLPFDQRFQNAQFKFESTDRMEIIGMIFRDFELDDDR